MSESDDIDALIFDLSIARTVFLTSLDAAVSLFETIPDTIPSCPRKCVVQALRMKGL